MQLAWTHLLPATFGGRARMNVQNALAAAAAAFAAGAPLHDIRQGLRTFSTNYYLSPGRLNEVEVNGVNVIVDYCHNAPGHADARRLRGPGRRERSSRRTSSAGRRGSASSPPPATAATRTCASSAHIAAQHFDVVVVREDVRAARPRARRDRRRWSPRACAPAMAEGARCKQVEVVLDEIEAVRHAMARANPGDLVVLCVDKHAAVMAELENWSHQAQAGRRRRPRRARRRPGLRRRRAGAA